MRAEEIRSFRKLLRAFEREVFHQNPSNSCGVTITQCHSLLEIEKLENTSVGDLAAVLGLDKSTVSRTIEGLVTIGLVDRSIPEHNRRSSLIRLTKQGKVICDEINNNNDAFFRKALAVMNDQELDTFLENFERVINGMKDIDMSLYENK